MTTTASLSRRRALLALGALAGGGLGSLAGLGRVATAHQEEPASPVSAPDIVTGPVVVASGTGSATGPVDRALVQIIARTGMGDVKSGMDVATPVDPNAMPPVTVEMLEPAAEVFRQAGIPDERILVVSGEGSPAASFFGVGAGMLGVELTAEELEQLPDLLEEATSLLLETGLLVDPPGVAYLSESCTELQSEALADAVEAARADAEALAAALEVEVTGLVRAVEFGYSYGPFTYPVEPGDGCDALPELEDLPRTYLAPYSPGVEPVLMVTANVELTFAVEPVG
jgi:uncharacterized protein YggE